MYRYFIFILTASVLVFLFSVNISLATSVRGGDMLINAAGSGGAVLTKEKKVSGKASDVLKTTLTTKVVSIIQMVLQVVGVAFLVIVIYAGITWMTAGGNQEKVSTAIKLIRNGAIGMIIVSLSWAITLFFETFIK